jgi:lipid-A-disaccharide synthase
MREAILVSNGPGELYTWARPVLHELRRSHPDVRVAISLIPCQFASGNEADIARTFGADSVTTPAQTVRMLAAGPSPAGFGADEGFVISLGGNAAMAVRLGQRFGYPTYRYSFVPSWHRKLERLFVNDRRTERKARLRGVPRRRLEVIGNLVADAVVQATPATGSGSPHIVLVPGSRDTFARHLIPFMIGVADELGARYPTASFVWPVSRLLRQETLQDGVDGVHADTLGGVSGARDGDVVRTPNGTAIRLVSEEDRYAHMRAADLAVTIPGTNTLELGIAGVPAVVVLPLNRPEIIPLEGIGHWLGLVPLIGIPLKRNAVRLFVERRLVAVALPNILSGEALMTEVTGIVSVEQVAGKAAELLDDDALRAEQRRRLLAAMPKPGAAARLVAAVIGGRPPSPVP